MLRSLAQVLGSLMNNSARLAVVCPQGLKLKRDPARHLALSLI